MAKLSILRQWPDGSVISVGIKVKASYPDCLDQARKTLLDAFREAHAETFYAEDAEE